MGLGGEATSIPRKHSRDDGLGSLSSQRSSAGAAVAGSENETTSSRLRLHASWGRVSPIRFPQCDPPRRAETPIRDLWALTRHTATARRGAAPQPAPKQKQGGRCPQEGPEPSRPVPGRQDGGKQFSQTTRSGRVTPARSGKAAGRGRPLGTPSLSREVAELRFAEASRTRGETRGRFAFLTGLVPLRRGWGPWKPVHPGG